MSRIYVPRINLKKFYLVSTMRDESKINKRIKMSRKVLASYIRFRNFLFNGSIDASDFETFISLLKEKIVEKIIPVEVLKDLSENNLPANPITLKQALASFGYDLSQSSAKSLFSLLKKLNLVSIIPTFYKVNNQADLIYSYLLRKGASTIKEIKDKFSNASWIYDALLELWSNDRVEIEGLDVPKEVYKKYGKSGIPLDLVNGSTSINIYLDRKTGEKKAEIILNPRSKVILSEIPKKEGGES